MSAAGEVLGGSWGDCVSGCPISGGGSKQGLCTDKCGSSMEVVSSAGYACYCDTACITKGDCCTGYQQSCGGGTEIVGGGGGGTGNTFLLGEIIILC